VTRDPLTEYVDALITGVEQRMPKVPPVVVVPCPICGGDGWIETRVDYFGIGHGHDCAYCAGRGRICTEGGEA